MLPGEQPILVLCGEEVSFAQKKADQIRGRDREPLMVTSPRSLEGLPHGNYEAWEARDFRDNPWHVEILHAIAVLKARWNEDEVERRAIEAKKARALQMVEKEQQRRLQKERQGNKNWASW